MYRSILLFACFIGLLPLPAAANEVVVNFATAEIALISDTGETRATYPVVLPKKSDWPTSFPVIGTIVSIEKNPSWYPTPRIRAEYARKHRKTGKTLPTRVSPGPRNPMGAVKMNIKYDSNNVAPEVKIHGTNEPDKLDLPPEKRLLSHGCIRMWNDHIRHLASEVTGQQIAVRFINDAETDKPPPPDPKPDSTEVAAAHAE